MIGRAFGTLPLILSLLVWLSSGAAAQGVDDFRACMDGCSKANANPPEGFFVKPETGRSSPYCFYGVFLQCRVDNPGSCAPSCFGGVCPYCPSEGDDGSTKSPPPRSESGPGSCGSEIDDFSLTLGERIPVAGTPYSLVYQSDRGRRSYEYHAEMAACSDGHRCRIDASAAGKWIGGGEFPGTPGDVLVVNWDGLNAAGTRLYFPEAATLTYTIFIPEYAATKARRESADWEVGLGHVVNIGPFDSLFYGLGGWLPDVLHAHHEPTRTLYFGDGSSVYVPAKPLAGGGWLVKSPSDEEWYEFDGQGRHLRTRTGLLGATVYSFGYDGAGRIATITDAGGLVTTIKRDATGKPTAIVAPFGQTTQLAVTAGGFLATVTDPAGNTTTMTYKDARGLLASIARPGVGPTRFTYDSLGLLVKDTNPTGRALTFSRNVLINGNIHVAKASTLGVTTSMDGSLKPGAQSTTVNAPAGDVSTYLSSFASKERSSNSSLGSTRTTYTDDPRVPGLRRVETVRATSPSSAVNRIAAYSEDYTLSDTSDPFSVQSASLATSLNGLPTTTTFDGATRTLLTTTPLGRKAMTKVNAREWITQTRWANLLPVNYTYDGFGRVTRKTQGTRSDFYQYGSDGNLAQATDALGRVTIYAYDLAGRMTRKTLADGRWISFAYNARGLLSSITPPGRPGSVYAYNAFDNVTQFRPPVLATVADPATRYLYDGDQRLSQVVRPSGATISYSYHGSRGTLVSVSTGTGTNALTTDALGRIVGSTYGDVTLGSTFDGVYETSSSIAWPGSSASVQRAFNALGLLLGQTVIDGSGSGLTTTLAYDDDQNPVQVGALALIRNATTGFVSLDRLGRVATTYTYNSYGELTGQKALANGNIIFQQTLTRDPLGRIIGVGDTAGGVTVARNYIYDRTGRLAAAKEAGNTVASYVYDRNSNRVGGFTRAGITSATYDAQDRILTYGGLTFGHDGDGQRQTMANASTGITIAYGYDSFGNLTSVSKPGLTVVYTIDGFGRRVARQVNGAEVRRYLYDGQLRVVAELDGVGFMVARFVYAPGETVPLYMEKGGATYRILTDANGSIRMVVNAATGAIAQQITYDEYGRVLADTAPGFQPFGFAGGLTDPDTGLVHFGARDYDPVTGRWLSQDPIGFSGGDTNLYGYVLQDPVNLVDGSGLSSNSCKYNSEDYGQNCRDAINDWVKNWELGDHETACDRLKNAVSQARSVAPTLWQCVTCGIDSLKNSIGNFNSK